MATLGSVFLLPGAVLRFPPIYMGGPDCLLLEGSVCDSHLHLWLQDSWVFWTKYLAAPLLKDVKDHALITWEMEFHRQFLKAIEDKLIQFIGSPETDI